MGNKYITEEIDRLEQIIKEVKNILDMATEKANLLISEIERE